MDDAALARQAERHARERAERIIARQQAWVQLGQSNSGARLEPEPEPALQGAVSGQ